jgi:hypothetical protein
VCFTPGGNCTDAIVEALNDAKRTILVQAYSFTLTPIAKAPLEAHKRGMQVQVILDEDDRTDKYSAADFLANQGVPTRIDAEHAIVHNKVIVIDGETVITGSFNASMIAALLAHKHNLQMQPPQPGAPRTQAPLHLRRLALPLAVACQSIAQAFDLKGAAAKRRWQQLAAWLTHTGESPTSVVAPRSWISSAAGTANPSPKGKPTAAI